MTSIYTAPVYKLQELNNLFIELTAKNCNQRCQSCYIDFGTNTGFSSVKKIVKDFISLDKIKDALSDLKHLQLHCIYLTGAEPMMHPDFNAILRLCLKKCNVCICTNGSYLNEKKIRFLNRVESEGQSQIFFNLSLTHFEELKNDSIKYRGNFRQTIFALKTLTRYNFSSVLSIQNYYDIDPAELLEKFKQIFQEQDIYHTDIQVKVSYPNYNDVNYSQPSQKTDCMYGRCLSASGIYSCPFLANDYRGRVGFSFKSFSENITAETDFCATCSKNNNFMFTIG